MRTGTINELESPLIAHLKPAYRANRAHLFPIVYFFVDFVADVVPAPLNKEDLAALVELVDNDVVGCELAVLQYVKQVYDEFTVVVILKSVKRVVKPRRRRNTLTRLELFALIRQEVLLKHSRLIFVIESFGAHYLVS